MSYTTRHCSREFGPSSSGYRTRYPLRFHAVTNIDRKGPAIACTRFSRVRGEWHCCSAGARVTFRRQIVSESAAVRLLVDRVFRFPRQFPRARAKPTRISRPRAQKNDPSDQIAVLDTSNFRIFYETRYRPRLGSRARTTFLTTSCPLILINLRSSYGRWPLNETV